MVRFSHISYPYWGVVIDEQGNTVRQLDITCGDFKLRGFRYKHHTWPAPNRDFIPITVELIDNASKWVVKSERHFIQVDIIGGTIRMVYQFTAKALEGRLVGKTIAWPVCCNKITLILR